MPSSLQQLASALRSELRPTLRLALPLVLAEIGWMSMGIVDTIMVGRLPDSAVAIGGVSLGQSLFYTVAIFGNGLLLGLDTLVSQAFGRRDLKDARHSLINGVAIAMFLMPVLMTLVWLWPPAMQRLGVNPDVLRAMRPFLYALSWSMPPLLLYFALRRYLQAVHMVKPITFALISANIVNTLMNWVFIYGHWGAPSMGVAGSGWSTCLARLYMALVLFMALLWGNRKYDLGLWRGPARIDFGRIGQLLKLGFGAAMQILMEVGGFAAVAALCGRLGTVAIASHQIAISAAAFTYMVPLGISSAAAVRVGHGLGRGDVRSARRSGWTAILLGGGFMLLAGIVFVSVPQYIARIFTFDPLVIRTSTTLLLIAAVFELFDGLQTVATGALRGAGDTRTPMIANFIAYWVLGLPVGYVLGFYAGWGAAGLWIGLCIGLIIVACSLLLAWHRHMHDARWLALHPVKPLSESVATIAD